MPFVTRTSKAFVFLYFLHLTHPLFGQSSLLCRLFCEPVRMLKWALKLPLNLAVRHSAEVLTLYVDGLAFTGRRGPHG